jgi:transketolase
MDGPTKAKSGHPGTAMALAPLAHVLFARIMNFDPRDPTWPDRDRFILSPGHASILQYAMLHLTGYELSRDDLLGFRVLGSKTPGHPEVHHTPGIEVTTGPLGQGFANAVGMAMAETHLRARYSEDLVNHYTFTVVGDGCLEEGISHEAASLAGHLGLGHLVAIYDDNHITIDGPTELALSDDAGARFRSYGWHVVELGEVPNDLDAIEAGIREAMAETKKPSLVILRTRIGYPSPAFTDSPAAHGNPFSADEVSTTKKILDLPDEPFAIPDGLLARYHEAIQRGRDAHMSWSQRAQSNPQWAALEGDIAGDVSAYEATPPLSFEAGSQVATRKSFAQSMAASSPMIASIMSGGADLTDNTGTELAGSSAFSVTNPAGSRVHYGVREHAMGAIMTGMALHGGVLPIGGTFFVFSDYMRGAIRVAAISKARVVYAFTHDSIGVGEDGPTHQPIEHLASLRAMPGLTVIRPADANETEIAWRYAVQSNGPVAMILSRQNVPVLEETARLAASRLRDGAYVLSDTTGSPDVVLIATGSEVSLCLEAAELMAAEGVAARVVSMPCQHWFDELDPAKQEQILPKSVPTLSVEAGSTYGWASYADRSLGIDRFGTSAPGSEIFAFFGITVDAVVAQATDLIATYADAE